MSSTGQQPAPPGARTAGNRFTEVVDARAGTIDAHGALTPAGADLLAGTVRQLRHTGVQQITVDLEDVQTTDPAALVELADLQRRLTAGGGELLLRRPPPDR